MIYLERNAKQQNCGGPLAPSMLIMIFGHHHHPILSAWPRAKSIRSAMTFKRGLLENLCVTVSWQLSKGLTRLRFLPHSFLPRNGHFRNLKSHGKNPIKLRFKDLDVLIQVILKYSPDVGWTSSPIDPVAVEKTTSKNINFVGTFLQVCRWSAGLFEMVRPDYVCSSIYLLNPNKSNMIHQLTSLTKLTFLA